MVTSDDPEPSARCSCQPYQLVQFLKVVDLVVKEKEVFEFRTFCQSKKNRTALLQEHSFCFHCPCGVCHPVPLLAVSRQHRTILLRLPPALNTALTSASRLNAGSRRQALQSIYTQLNITTQEDFFRGGFEDYLWYAHFEAAHSCRPLPFHRAIPGEESYRQLLESSELLVLETGEKLFEGQPRSNLFQCLILRTALDLILALPARQRQVVIARFKHNQVKNKHLYVVPLLEQLAQRAYFDDPAQARTRYELLRNLGIAPSERQFRPPIHAGDMPELQIILQLEQPAVYYRSGEQTVFEHFPRTLLNTTFYYAALNRLGSLEGRRLESSQLSQPYETGFLWKWQPQVRKNYFQRIEEILKTFNDEYRPTGKNPTAAEIKSSNFRVSENLLELADSRELHATLDEAVHKFFQVGQPGQDLMNHLVTSLNPTEKKTLLY